MPRWDEFEAAAPEMAAPARWLLSQNGGVAFLATVRKDGSPQLHPVMPYLVDGGLYVFIVQFSSKHGDLLARPRYALHTIPAGPANLEFLAVGSASPVADPALRARAVEVCGFPKADWETLFHFDIDRALTTEWAGWGTNHPQPTFRRWKPGRPMEVQAPA